MRRHIYRVLGVNPEDGLPPSRHEDLPLTAKEPVRFVWEKTIKQSRHNAQMKECVLADLRANRRLYKHVPEADFSHKTVSSAFDQAFSTFRQKYKAQLDPTVSLTVKTREEQKAMKSRRLHRKKFVRASVELTGSFTFTGYSRSESNESLCETKLMPLLIRHLTVPWNLSACRLRSRMKTQN